MVNPTIKITDVNFDEELFANDEWLQVIQHKDHIDITLFGEIIPLETTNQVKNKLVKKWKRQKQRKR